MTLHSSELARIAKVLARLFPDFDQRQRFASKAEVGAQAQIAGEVVEAWRDIVHCAHVEGTLHVLMKAAVAERPQEKELRRLLESMDGEPPRGLGRYVLVAGVLLLFGLLSFGLFDGADGLPDASESAVGTRETPREGVPLAAQSENQGAAADNPDWGSSSASSASVDGSEEPVAPPPSLDRAIAAEFPGVDGEVSGRCGGARNALVGYFYANEGIPAEVGQPYTMKRDVNVRADYPRKENQWSASQPVVCVLQRSDVVVLSSPPFEVDGAKIWVPLHAGDLQP